MKKIAIFLVFLTGCIPYKSYLKTDDICGFDMTITEEEKCLDFTKYDSLLTKGNLTITDNESILKEYRKYSNNKYTYVIKQVDKPTNISKWTKYNAHGHIRYVYFTYVNGGLKIGQGIYFDSLGNITQVIDHRHANNYPICFKEALMIAEKLKPKKDSIFGIDREWEATVTDTLYYWEVFVQEPKPDKDEPTLGDAWIYRIDAQTGKLLRKMQLIQGHDDTAP
ncbi:hypothetical protein AAG747_10640 [Rapidithrix thailandica]|uniref:Lipoprotein n=1 Tax=Rapidithrix thailandica TaxID=413964 RepID=A0AAW9RTZ2_9BACT